MRRNPRGRAVPRLNRGSTLPVLDGIRVSWEWLCVDPHPVTVAGAEIDGLSDRPIPLDELRTLMLDPGTGTAVRDAVWSYLLTRSRRDGPTWTVACAGMALPMLAGVYRECVPRSVGDRDDIASEIVAGFVAALATIDLARPGLVSALRWAALRAGLGAIREAVDAPIPHPHDRLLADVLNTPIAGSDAETATTARRWESAPPPARSAHPDLVLAAAVADGVITTSEAELIGETRLQGVALGAVAERAGRTVGAVTMRRLRAEMRLVDHLLGPDGAQDRRDAVTPGTATPPRPPSSSRTVSDARGEARRSAGAEGDASGSPSVKGRRRRRTRGARREQAGQVTR